MDGALAEPPGQQVKPKNNGNDAGPRVPVSTVERSQHPGDGAVREQHVEDASQQHEPAKQHDADSPARLPNVVSQDENRAENQREQTDDGGQDLVGTQLLRHFPPGGAFHRDRNPRDEQVEPEGPCEKDLNVHVATVPKTAPPHKKQSG